MPIIVLTPESYEDFLQGLPPDMNSEEEEMYRALFLVTTSLGYENPQMNVIVRMQNPASPSGNHEASNFYDFHVSFEPSESNGESVDSQPTQILDPSESINGIHSPAAFDLTQQAQQLVTPTEPGPTLYQHIISNPLQRLVHITFCMMLLFSGLKIRLMGIVNSLFVPFFAMYAFENDFSSGQASEWKSIKNILSVVLLCIHIWIPYIVFVEEKLYSVLYFQLPLVEEMDVWTLAWIIGITGLVLKFICLFLKSVIVMWLEYNVQIEQMGKYFKLVEKVMHFYGCLIPIVPWLYFLKHMLSGIEWFSLCFLGIYLLFKLKSMCKIFSDLRMAYKEFMNNCMFGMKPTCEEVQIAGKSCPICHDYFVNPVKLSCQHIFCEECVTQWFTRKKSCPMCRAQITKLLPELNVLIDYFIQWY